MAMGMYLVILALLSAVAFWRLHPVLFIITAAMSLMVGLYAPDLLTGNTSTPLSLSMGLILVLYAFLNIGFAYRTLFKGGGDNGASN